MVKVFANGTTKHARECIDTFVGRVLVLLVLQAAILRARSAGIRSAEQPRSKEYGADTPTTRRITARKRADDHSACNPLCSLYLPRASAPDSGAGGTSQ